MPCPMCQRAFEEGDDGFLMIRKASAGAALPVIQCKYVAVAAADTSKARAKAESEVPMTGGTRSQPLHTMPEYWSAPRKM